MVGGHIAKYDESFNPRAFGDLMQQWGTSTVLIESGGWRGDPEKQYLRKVNFVALVAALDRIADGTYESFDVAAYQSLPSNGRAARDLVIRGGTVVIPGFEPYRADIAIDLETGFDDSPRVVEIGDLLELQARDTIDATGLFIHPTPTALAGSAEPRGYLRIGAIPTFVIRTTAGEVSKQVYSIENGVKQ
jgi:hypothetical protein